MKKISTNGFEIKEAKKTHAFQHDECNLFVGKKRERERDKKRTDETDDE